MKETRRIATETRSEGVAALDARQRLSAELESVKSVNSQLRARLKDLEVHLKVWGYTCEQCHALWSSMWQPPTAQQIHHDSLADCCGYDCEGTCVALPLRMAVYCHPHSAALHLELC